MRPRTIILTFLLLALAASVNRYVSHTSVWSEKTVLVDGQEIRVLLYHESDGFRLTLNGNGHSLVLDSPTFEDDLFIKQPIRSISIINAPGSIIENQDRNTSIELVNSENSIIRNNNITDITNSSYAYGIMLDNSPNTEIYNNTIINIISTSNSASAIYLMNSQNTTIRNNTIEQISSTSSSLGSPRDVSGIRLYNSIEVNIVDTRIQDLESLFGMAYGILVEASRGSNITESYIGDISSKSSHGIYVDDSSTMIIKNNKISAIFSSTLTSSGISLDDSPHSQIIVNNITSVDAGLLEVKGIYLEHCTGATIGNNTIQYLSSTYTYTYGINLKTSNSVFIEWNVISNLISSNSEAIGIFTEGDEYLAVRYNTITDISSSFGLYIIRCNNSVLIENVLSDIQDWIYIDETSQNVQYSENTVEGQLITLESFIRPKDLIIEEGNITNSLSWTAKDPNAQSYTIYRDNILTDSGEWIDNILINHQLNYSLSVGSYSYRLVLTESTGMQIIDEVQVTVLEMDLPQLVDSPDDLYLGFGTKDQILSWTISDNYPADYLIYLNGTEVESDSWASLESINYSISFLGVDEYTVFNYTLLASDTSGNIVNDTVLVFVGIIVEIRTEMSSQMWYEYEKIGEILDLNWTVISTESGTYTIYQDNGTRRIVISTGVFVSGEPILHQIVIDDLPVGTYRFSIIVNQFVEDYVTVTVYANPDIPRADEQTNQSIPHQPIPPYLAQPEANPWPNIIMTGFLVLAASGAGYWYITRRLMVPSAVKDEIKALKKARKAKDKHEEGKRLGAIGRIYFKAGNFKRAIQNHKEALKIFKKTKNKKFQIKELESLGDAYFAQGVEEA
ncbi:MAG: right-handed parallel beta-helix repeat-containing protein [Promethearchaeota archaeon]